MEMVESNRGDYFGEILFRGPPIRFVVQIVQFANCKTFERILLKVLTTKRIGGPRKKYAVKTVDQMKSHVRPPCSLEGILCGDELNDTRFTRWQGKTSTPLLKKLSFSRYSACSI